jgi:pilus assembly protein FimV
MTAAAKPKPRVRMTPPPPPESSLIDDLLGNPLYLAGGAAALGLLGFLGIRTARRRREAAYDDSVVAEKKNFDVASPATRTDVTGAMAAAARAVAAGADAQVTEEVDPLAEAEIYLAYGRDGQAEEILKEALHASPRRHEVHLKLLEIYAKRKDVAAFDTVARELQGGTGGQGEIWLQAVRLGHALDPQNPRYAAGKPAGGQAVVTAAAAPVVAAPRLEERLDFNIGLEDTDTGTKTDIDLTRLGAAAGGTTTDFDLSSLGAPNVSDIDLSTMSGMPEQAMQMPDLDLDLGAAPAAEEKSGGLDFEFDLSGVSAAPAAQPPQRAAEETTQILNRSLMQTVADVGEPGMGTVEFDLSKISLDTGGLGLGKTEPTLDVSGGVPSIPEIDLSGISLDLGGETTSTGGAAAGTSAGKDDHWYDVQTKFDLAKAYQEMGDKEGAREILQEVIAEGDPEQKAAARKVLETLA